MPEASTVDEEVKRSVVVDSSKDSQSRTFLVGNSSAQRGVRDVAVEKAASARSPVAVASVLPVRAVSKAENPSLVSLRSRERVGAVSAQFMDLKAQLQKGAELTLPLMDGKTTTGVVNLVQNDGGSSLRAGGKLTGGDAGSFSLAFDEIPGGTGAYATLLLTDRKKAYIVSSAEGGRLQMHERPLSAVMCNLEGEKSEVTDSETGAEAPAAVTETVVYVPLHSSHPEAEAVLYLDFDGEAVTDVGWNGGLPIVAAPANQSPEQMTETWVRVKEDFSPFNIDITTDLARYESAPVGKRMRIIVTSTFGWFNNASALGVAYTDSFDRAGKGTRSANIPCWAFTKPDKSDPYRMADVISHELGHTLGLSHDGQPGDPYYRAYGAWAPIMGGPGPGLSPTAITQWSKGEYAGATEQEDDIAIIGNATNGFGFVADDVGGTIAEAVPLNTEGEVISQSGLISNETDVDYFSFVTPGGNATIQGYGPSAGGNLDVGLELLNAEGDVLGAAGSDYGLNATMQMPLAAGTYYLRVRGKGWGNPSENGYSTYGSLGHYAISGLVRHGFLELVSDFQALNTLSTVHLGLKSTDGASVRKTLTLRNTGQETMTGLAISFSGEDVADFSAGPLPATSLAPNEILEFEVLFAPSEAGHKRVAMDVMADQSQRCQIHLTGEAFLPGDSSVYFLEYPMSAAARVGENLTFTAQADGGLPRLWTWFKYGKNNVPVLIADANGSSLTLNSLKSTDAGEYSATVEVNGVSAAGSRFQLMVVAPGVAEINVKEGSAATLSAMGYVPAGYAAPYYRWMKDGAFFDPAVSGPTLKLTGMNAGKAGIYTCHVTMNGWVTVTSGETQVRVVPKPILDDIILPNLFVSQAVEQTITAAHFPSSFSAKGLPPGIVLNKVTGKLSGSPTAAKVVKGEEVPYKVIFSAANAAGTSVQSREVDWLIKRLPEVNIGLFNGLVDRHEGLNANLGGSLSLAVLGTGSFTATLKLGSVIHKFKGSLVIPAGGGDASGKVNIPVKGKTVPLRFTVTIPSSGGDVAGSVGDGVGEPCEFLVRRAVWSAKNPATGYAVKSTAAILPPDSVLEEDGLYPQGEGCLTLSVSTAGIATWGGRLADGSTITASSTLDLGGRVSLQVMVNKNMGSAQGWQTFDKGSQNLDGTLTWMKAGQPMGSNVVDRHYRSGFPEHTLEVKGGIYTYMPGQPLLGLTDAEVLFEHGGLAEPMLLSTNFTSKGALVAGANDYLFKPAIKAATGLYSGSFTLSSPEKRVAGFNGVLVLRLGRGAGHFLLPEVSSPPGTTPKTVPLRSGRAVIRSAAP